MWRYGDSRRYQAERAATSTYDLLVSMRGAAMTLLFLDLRDPERPVAQIPGFLETVSSSGMVFGLAAPLPRLESQTRFGVELMAGPGILRFQSAALHPVRDGAVRVELPLPRQVESVQRRKFSRVSLSIPVAFASTPEQEGEKAPQGGIGHSIDLSGGGIRLVTPVALRYGQRLFVSFHTPDGAAFRGLPARVVRTQSEGDRQTVGLQFVDLPEEQEGQLVQTVFRLQLKGLAGR